MREKKRFLHFRSQWPWPLDLKFAPQAILVCTKLDVSTAFLFRDNRTYGTDVRTGCNNKCAPWRLRFKCLLRVLRSHGLNDAALQTVYLSSGCCHQIDIRYQCLVGFYHRGRSPTHWTFFETWNSLWFLSAWLAYCRDPRRGSCWCSLSPSFTQWKSSVTHTRTVMVTIYVTGDMIELLHLITTSEIS